jgi:hypothetical protein
VEASNGSEFVITLVGTISLARFSPSQRFDPSRFATPVSGKPVYRMHVVGMRSTRWTTGNGVDPS